MSKLLLILLVASLAGIIQGFDTSGHCVWYDVCGKDPDPPNNVIKHIFLL
jgi:hypothetical protein